MKNLRVLFISVLIFAISVFGANYQDNNHLTHSIDPNRITSSTTGYVDINAQSSLSVRTLEPSKSADQQRKKIYGDIETIGASILMPTQGYGFAPTTAFGNDTVIQTFNFIKEDGNYAKNSARATFDFKQMIGTTLKDTHAEAGLALDGSKVIFARLYWGGGISHSWSISDPNAMRHSYFQNIQDFNKIKFGTPNPNGSGMVYHNLTATEANTRWYGSYSVQGMQFTYQASADVTELVQKSLGKTKERRTFSAGDIKASNWKPRNFYGYRDNGWVGGLYAPHYGGWALVVVYDFGDEGAAKGIKPKGVYIYDGLTILAPIHLRGQQFRIDSLEAPISGFFTPASGPVNSSLTVLSFGAKYEVGRENIEILDSNGVYKSVTSNQYNKSGFQFNSTITKFDKPMSSTKIYNNQMDLDVFSLTNHMSNKQTSTNIKLTAQVISRGNSGVIGERANIGLAAFATELYEPQVCYVEKLLIRNQGKTQEQDFREVSTNAATKTTAKTGDTLRVQLIIKNNGNEDAEKIAISGVIDKNSAVYTENTSYVKPTAARDSVFQVTGANKTQDNTGLQEYADNVVKFFVGRGATGSPSASGGTIDRTNQALIQFDTTLEKEFKPDSFIYNAKFVNKAINLEFDGKINRCDDKKYHLEIVGINNKVVNEKFTQIGDSENLFTQIAGKKFNVGLANIMTTSDSGKSLKNFNVLLDIIDTKKLSIDAIAGGNCKNGVNIMTNPPFVKTRSELTGKSIIPLENIVIPEAYPHIYFRISYLDDSNNPTRDPSCLSDSFSTRPKELRFYNNNDGSQNFTNLIGGRIYNNIWLQATNNDNSLSQKYSTKISPINFIRSNNVPSTCTADFTFLNATTLTADFSNGKGQLRRLIRAGTASDPELTDDFLYTNIGHVAIRAKDTKWTTVDQDSMGSTDADKNDCIPNSSTINHNAAGKVGCNIETPQNLDLLFLPNDILIDNLQILNHNNGAMTYMSNDNAMVASAIFNTTARLDEGSGRAAATLYTRGCYANNVNLRLDLDPAQDIPDYNNGQGVQADRINIALASIIYPTPNSANIIKIPGSAQNIGRYQILPNAFTNGVATMTVNFNFNRAVQTPMNPFQITSNNFRFTNISDTNPLRAAPGAPYAAPTTVTTSSFYYGRVYAPDYTGPATGFNENVYYGVFCNGCNQITYSLANGAPQWNPLPSTNGWFINATHTPIMGLVNNYTPDSVATTTVTINNPVNRIVNGIENIRLSSTIPGTDIIRMQAPSWLIFSPTYVGGPIPVNNSFKVNFVGNNAWGGQSLGKEGKNDAGIGSVIGGDNLQAPNKTNKRLEW